MKRRPRTAAMVWLSIIGVAASIGGGLIAANYAVGELDPFYRSRVAQAWSPTTASDDVPVVRDDGILPSATPSPRMPDPTLAVTTAPVPGPAPLPDYADPPDWDAIDAKAQRDLDHALALAEAPVAALPPAVVHADPPPPRARPQPMAPPAAGSPAGPATPNGTLIY